MAGLLGPVHRMIRSRQQRVQGVIGLRGGRPMLTVSWQVF